MALEWLAGVMGEAYTPELEAAIEKELGKHFVPRASFNEINTKLKDANSQLGELESLKTAKATAEASVLDLQKQLKNKDLDVAIGAVLDSAHVVSRKAVLPLLDMSKVKLNDKGEVEGVTEQLEALKKTEPWIISQAGAANGRMRSQLPLSGASSTLPGGSSLTQEAASANADAFMNGLLRGDRENA